MSEKLSEKSKMSVVEFSQFALRTRIAPPEYGSVKSRIRKAAARLGWSFTRTKDVWYADDRVSISGEQLIAIEEASGLRYAKQELIDAETLISRADALLDGADADFYRPFVAALRAFVGAQNRP